MRIEAYTQVHELYNSSKVQKGQSVSRKGRTDQLSLSTMGLDYQTAKASVASAQDIRYDVCDSLKKSINDGTYEVSKESFAEKLISKYAEMR